MSFWINKLKCKDCGQEFNVQGGVIGTTDMNSWIDGKCPNAECKNTSNTGRFENLGSAIPSSVHNEARSVIPNYTENHYANFTLSGIGPWNLDLSKMNNEPIDKSKMVQ